MSGDLCYTPLSWLDEQEKFACHKGIVRFRGLDRKSTDSRTIKIVAHRTMVVQGGQAASASTIWMFVLFLFIPHDSGSLQFGHSPIIHFLLGSLLTISKTAIFLAMAIRMDN